MEEDELRPKPVQGLPRPLEGLSVGDLQAYRTALQREIERVDVELARRQSVRGAAEALFRPPPREAR